MVIGSLRVRLLVRQSRSLKDKRQVVRSLKDRLQNRFNVSVAEVDALDHRQLAVLGFAMVSNEAAPVQSAFNEIVAALADRAFVALQDNGYGQYDELIQTLAPSLANEGLERLKSHVIELSKTPVARPPQKERTVIGWSLGRRREWRGARR